jgi:hypothetical protein
MRKLFAVATMAMLATAANAVTLTSFAGAPDPGPLAGQTIVFDFEAPTPELSGSYSLVSGSVGGEYAAPAGDGTQFAVVPADGAPTPGVALLDLTGFINPIRSLSLYWGSIDQYNTLEFLDGDSIIYTITGGMLPPADGDQIDGGTNRRVNVDFGFAGQSLTALRFTSDGKAFEFDDIAIGGVPEPQTWAMLIIGFGLVGVTARRRNRTTIVTA